MSLRTQNLSYKIANQTLLDGINLEALEGEVLGIIGPNGAGKSTLLKHIAAILPLKKEQVMLDGIDFVHLKPRQLSLKIAYLSQFSQIPRISVLETLELGRRARSGTLLTSHDRKKIDEIVQQFECAHLLNRFVETLSGGEQQKVLIAAALLQEPKILLLDEPISHLDPKNQLEMLNAIHQATYDKGLITLMVLHDIQHAIHYTNKLLLLKNGKIRYHIRTEEIDAAMLKELFDVDVRLHKSEGHTFVYYFHPHHGVSHKGQKHIHETVSM